MQCHLILKKLSQTDLKEAGFKVVKNAKFFPRLIVYGIPADMTSEDIQEAFVA